MAKFLSYFVPDEICHSIYDVDFDRHLAEGKRVIIMDVDNTLVRYHEAEPDEKLCRFLFSLRDRGFSLALVSNNSPERVELFNRRLGFFSVADAHKPLKGALSPLVNHFQIQKGEAVMIGDQLFTDVFAAHRWGFDAVVVDPVEKRENRFFRLKRFLEKPFRDAYYRRKRKEGKWS